MYERKKRLKNWWLEYERETLLTLSRTTWVNRSKGLARFFEFVSQEKMPENVSRASVLDWLEALKAQGYGESSVSYHRKIVCGFYNWMISKGVLTWNPADRPEKDSHTDLRHAARREADLLSSGKTQV